MKLVKTESERDLLGSQMIDHRAVYFPAVLRLLVTGTRSAQESVLPMTDFISAGFGSKEAPPGTPKAAALQRLENA